MSTSPTPEPVNWVAELRELVNDAFDTNDLHSLCLDLKIDFDEIPGEGEIRKVVELIQILARQQRIPELIENCQRMNPRRNWQPLLERARNETLSFHLEDEPEAEEGFSLIDFDGDKALIEKLATCFSGVRAKSRLIFIEGVPGWELSAKHMDLAEEILYLGKHSELLRDKTFSPNEGILLDFALDEVRGEGSVVTFSLQNAPTRQEATRRISLQTHPKPEAVVVEKGVASPASQYARNVIIEPHVDYTVMMALDGNGRFLTMLFKFEAIEQDALFTFVQPEAWANDIWRFTIETGHTKELILLGGWEFTFDSVND